MNDTQREILAFMRDITVPEQSVSLPTINNNLEVEVRQAHLDSLESKGLIESSDGEGPVYWLTSEGLQIITTSDLDDTLSETNSNLKQLRRAQTINSAVQVLFVLTILTFTRVQISSKTISSAPQIDAIYGLSMLLILYLGFQPLYKSVRVAPSMIASDIQSIYDKIKSNIRG